MKTATAWMVLSLSGLSLTGGLAFAEPADLAPRPDPKGHASIEAPVGTSDRSESPIDYLIISQRIQELLTMVERDTGMRIAASEAVRGRVRNLRISGTVAGFLDKIGRRHDLDWFEFGGTYHVSARSEATLRLLRLGKLDPERAKLALENAGLDLTRFPVRHAADRAALSLSGPPRMLAIAEAIIESIPETADPVAPADKTVRVRRGTEMTLQPVPGAG